MYNTYVSLSSLRPQNHRVLGPLYASALECSNLCRNSFSNAPVSDARLVVPNDYNTLRRDANEKYAVSLLNMVRPRPARGHLLGTFRFHFFNRVKC